MSHEIQKQCVKTPIYEKKKEIGAAGGASWRHKFCNHSYNVNKNDKKAENVSKWQ